jgi:hypothetical protein
VKFGRNVACASALVNVCGDAADRVDRREAFGFGAHQFDFFVKRGFQLAREIGGAVVVVTIPEAVEQVVDSGLKWHGPHTFFKNERSREIG